MTSPENLSDQFADQKVPYKPHFMAIPYTDTEGNSGYSKIVNKSGRHHVLAWVRGTKVPFYVSTGMGGKTNVEEGKWYPHFGIGSDGWINKGNENNINTYYGSSHLKDVAEWLNTNVGDTRGAPSKRSWLGGYDGSGVPHVDDKGPHVDAINADMSPVTLKDETPVKEHAVKVLRNIHYKPRQATAQERMEDSATHDALAEHASKNPDLNLGTWLP